MQDNKWIKELKVGDKFIIREQYGKGLKSYTVTKITNTQIVSENMRFWKAKNGRMVGSMGWHIAYMEQLTEDAKNDLLRQKIQYLILHIDYNKISIEQLRNVYNFLINIYNSK